MIRVLIADDHSIVREGLKHVVSTCRDMQLVGEAEDAVTLFDALGRTSPDVVVVDVTMPGPGILEVIRRLKSITPPVRVLVLSMHPEKYYARRVLSAGADGYLTKNYSAKALPSALRQVYAGKKYVTPALAQELADNLTRGGLSIHEALSNREYEVFLLIGAGKNVHSIANELGLSEKTVRTYRSRIVEKTGFSCTAELIFYAVSKGLVGELSGEFRPIDAEDEAGKRVRTSVKRAREYR